MSKGCDYGEANRDMIWKLNSRVGKVAAVAATAITLLSLVCAAGILVMNVRNDAAKETLKELKGLYHVPEGEHDLLMKSLRSQNEQNAQIQAQLSSQGQQIAELMRTTKRIEDKMDRMERIP